MTSKNGHSFHCLGHSFSEIVFVCYTAQRQTSMMKGWREEGMADASLLFFGVSCHMDRILVWRHNKARASTWHDGSSLFYCALFVVQVRRKQQWHWLQKRNRDGNKGECSKQQESSANYFCIFCLNLQTYDKPIIRLTPMCTRSPAATPSTPGLMLRVEAFGWGSDLCLTVSFGGMAMVVVTKNNGAISPAINCIHVFPLAASSPTTLTMKGFCWSYAGLLSRVVWRSILPSTWVNSMKLMVLRRSVLHSKCVCTSICNPAIKFVAPLRPALVPRPCLNVEQSEDYARGHTMLYGPMSQWWGLLMIGRNEMWAHAPRQKHWRLSQEASIALGTGRHDAAGSLAEKWRE